MNPCFASTMNFSYGDQILVDASEYMKMKEELAMLRMEKAALTDSNQNKDEIILNLTNENKSLKNENKNSKNDYNCLLGQHVGVMLEKNEEVREKEGLKEKLGLIKSQLEEKVVENKKIRKELDIARAQYEEQQQKTNELLTNAEQHFKEQEKNVELLKNAEVELEEKEHLIQLKERELSDEKFWSGRHYKQSFDLSHKLNESKERNKKLFEENISFGKELGRMKKAGCMKRLLKRW